jgi:hypothetical protein
MPSRKFKLEAAGPERLELRWSGIFNNTEVLFDGQAVGAIPDKAAIKAGQRLALPDGSELWVQLEEKFGGGGLAVLRNGVPVPGSDTDPATLVKGAANIVYFIAGLNLVLGAVAMAGVEFLQNLGIGLYNIAFGALYLVLGYFTGKRSRVALGVAMGIFLVDGVLGIAATVAAGHTPGGGGIGMRVVLLITMVRSFQAMGALSTAPTTPQPYR